jgi:GAF domain-containing protein
MFEVNSYGETLEEGYELVLKQAEALISSCDDEIANLSNASALLNLFLNDINWVGFYLNKNNELILGPFQGLPACTNIKIGRGVCGTAASTLETQLIDNVHEFPGHIACDANSKSEIVIPIVKNQELYGVLDIDAPIYNRFTETDQKYLEMFVEILVKYL